MNLTLHHRSKKSTTFEMETKTLQFRRNSIYEFQNNNSRSYWDHKENLAPCKMRTSEAKFQQLAKKAKAELNMRQAIKIKVKTELIEEKTLKELMSISRKSESNTPEINLSTIENFHRLPPLLSPIKIRNKVANINKHSSSPFFMQLTERLIDAELKNMIDIFAKNIENLAKSTRNVAETDEIESFVGRKRRYSPLPIRQAKRQIC